MLRPHSLILAVAVMFLAGCGGEKGPPVAHGAWHALAPGLWDIDPARVTVPPMPAE